MKITLTLVAALLVALACPRAEAQRKRKGKKVAAPLAKPVVIDAFRDKLQVLKSASDTYLAVVPGKTDMLWFGTAKAMYRQKTRGGGGNIKKGYSYFWEPRAGKGFYASGNRYRHQMGKIAFKDDIGNLECGKRKTAFMLLPQDKADAFLAKAKFFERRWKREAYSLARDHKGRYSYVDRLQRDHGGQGYRVFVGYRGKVKPTRLKNLALDSAGAVFFTRKGNLRLVMSRNTSESFWARRGKESKLIELPVYLNRYMIYAELGVYDGIRLGTPCDEH
jgi:hypothetical protein